MRRHSDIFLSELADKDDSVRLIVADVGDFSFFRDKHPDKYLNVGVSESNAIGIAAGMASQGMNVFVYGISSFFIYRAFEQLKLAAGYWNQRITFLGVGFGWKFFYIGAGHFCPDDISLMRHIPEMKIFAPCSYSSLQALLSQDSHGPRYIRFTSEIVESYDSEKNLDAEYIIVSYGEMVKRLYAIACDFKDPKRIGFLFPLDLTEKSIELSLSRVKNKKIIIVEDQYKLGSLFSLLKEWDFNIVYYQGLPLKPDKIAESKEKLRELYGFGAASLKRDIERILHE